MDPTKTGEPPDKYYWMRGIENAVNFNRAAKVLKAAGEIKGRFNHEDWADIERCFKKKWGSLPA